MKSRSDKGLFELLPNDVFNLIIRNITYRDTVLLYRTCTAMNDYFKSIPNWPATIIEINDFSQKANELHPSYIEKIFAKKPIWPTEYLGALPGGQVGAFGALILSYALHVDTGWKLALVPIGAVAGGVIGYGYNKLGLFSIRMLQSGLMKKLICVLNFMKYNYIVSV